MAQMYNVTNVNATDTLANITGATTTAKSGGVLGFGELELYTEFWVAYYLNQFYLRVLSGIGVLFNMAVFLTIYALKPFTTSSFYVAFLAILDTLAVITKLLYVELTRTEILFGDSVCKFVAFFGSFTMQYANWVLVLMTLERLVAVCFPLKVSRISTMTKAKVTLAIAAILLAAFNLHILWTIRAYHYSDGRSSCKHEEKYGPFMETVWPWLDSLVFGLAPCVLLIVRNGLIIFSLRRAMAAQKTMTESEAPGRNYHQTQLTAMLVSVSIAFVCCLLPRCVFDIVEPYWDYKQSTLQHAKYLLVMHLAYFLTDCNHVINFFFFFLAGKRFRKVFLAFICCRKRPQNKMQANRPTT